MNQWEIEGLSLSVQEGKPPGFLQSTTRVPILGSQPGQTGIEGNRVYFTTWFELGILLQYGSQSYLLEHLGV